MERKTNDAYKISEQTADFIECYRMAQNLYEKISDAVEKVYGETQMDTVMEKFCGKWSDMAAEIENFITNSIFENLNDERNERVI